MFQQSPSSKPARQPIDFELVKPPKEITDPLGFGAETQYPAVLYKGDGKYVPVKGEPPPVDRVIVSGYLNSTVTVRNAAEEQAALADGYQSKPVVDDEKKGKSAKVA